MPSVFEAYGYKCYFNSNESYPLEPVHVHFAKKPHENATKYWLKSDGTLELAYDSGEIPQKDLKKLLNVANSYAEQIACKWAEHFGQIEYMGDITK